MDDNVCKQCGGTRLMQWTIGFEGGRPLFMRADPETLLKLCPGHPNRTAASDDWEGLTDKQRYSMYKLRQRMHDHFQAELTVFLARYPELQELQLEWDFTIDAFIQGERKEI